MKKIKLVILAALLLMSAQMANAQFWLPHFLGDVSGVRGQLFIPVDTDLTADMWLWGDTLGATSAYYPDQPMQIDDIKVYHNSDAGDTFFVRIYSYEAGAGAQLVALTDTCIGTAPVLHSDISTYGTLSDTYAVITPTEGMGIQFDFLAGTPNDVFIMIDYTWRKKETLE